MTRRAWRGFAGRVMVVVQVAACVVLLAASGLALQTVRNLNAVDVGFDTDNLLVFRVDVGQGTDSSRPSPYEELAAAIDAVPGVASTTFSAVPLLAHMQWSETVQPDAGRPPNEAYFQAVRWNFFETLGLRRRSGRGLSQSDHARATPVAVINETMARQLFDDPNPIGRHFKLLTGPGRDTQIEVVGIVNDAKYSSVDESSPPTFYLPSAQFATAGMTFGVRTAVEPSRLIPLVRDAVRQAAPGVAMQNVKTQEQQNADTMAKPRALATAAGVFSLVGVLLACLGIFGVVSYDVTRRTRELGIRIALGARRTDVLRLVLKDVLVVTLVGAGVGVAVTANATKLIASLLFGVTPADPATLAASVVVLTTAATLAALWPARRASRLNPIEALRCD